MKKFAKLFECPVKGQILVTLDQNDDDQPEIKFSVKPEGLGICSMKTTYNVKNEESPWESAERVFEDIDFKAASNTVAPLFEISIGFVTDEE